MKKYEIKKLAQLNSKILVDQKIENLSKVLGGFCRDSYCYRYYSCFKNFATGTDKVDRKWVRDVYAK